MNKEFFMRNRKNLGESIEEGIIVIFAGKAPYKSADETYPFTPNRNFYYLTGIEEEQIKLDIPSALDDLSAIIVTERSSFSTG